jgi:hypothetical protein
MRQGVVLVGVIFAAAPLPACHFGDVALTARQTQVETRALDPGGSFSLSNTNGRVEVLPGSERQARIEITKAASDSAALAAIAVSVVGQGHRVEVRTKLPRTGWWLFGPRGRVDYRITLPVGAHLDVATINGAVHVSGLAGPVRVRTVNGDVRVEDAASVLVAETVNGSIDAGYRAALSEGAHRLTTTNGSVHVRLPQDARGSLRADTVNGRIVTNLPLSVEGRFGGKHLTGTLRDGGGHLAIRTVNGSVAVNQR